MNTENDTVAVQSQAPETATNHSAWVGSEIERLNDEYKRTDDAAFKEKDASQKRLHQLLANQWAVIREINKDDGLMEAFKEEVARRGVNIPKPHENIYLMFVRVFSGQWRAGSSSAKASSKTRKWTPNKSHEKYAGLFRWFSEHPDELQKVGGDAARLINDFDGGTGVGKKTSGIMMADRIAHGSKRTVITEESFHLLHGLPAIAAIPARADAFTLSEGKIGLALVRYNDTGALLEILGDAKPSQEEITRHTKAFVTRANSNGGHLDKTTVAA